ncbi:MAG: hypothetical protein NZ772_10125 [Cyanobacteria bacterium]|nr:hypothetical protein [Cyanobacteriota bacterium]MDW8201363.1 hypothetical protein [Cyanobacteriota bacterium SKYGB_h_bin112]
MPALTPSIRRRLLQLKQLPSVWEGARLQMPLRHQPVEFHTDDHGSDCILWVDGSEGIVRAVEVVSPISGQEAVVRALLRAMEMPQNPGKPARPQKIVVNDRELQFFLRGVLQDMDIIVDYVPSLPLIDEFYRHFAATVESCSPQLSPQLIKQLNDQAFEIWHRAPWEYLSEERIIAVDLNAWDLETLYISIMGMLGIEYGILMYRSIDSLRQFRQAVMNIHEPTDEAQEAFLQQDCLFVTFDRDDSDDSVFLARLGTPEIDDIQPSFGSIHPLEGLRFNLQDDEANAMLVALSALNRFLKQHQRELTSSQFPELSNQYRIAVPANSNAKGSTVTVRISTMPALATELLTMMDDSGEANNEAEDINTGFPFIQDTLVPDEKITLLRVSPWEEVQLLRQQTSFYQEAPAVFPQVGNGLPIVILQISQPKGKALIQAIQTAGGLRGICFNPGFDPYAKQTYELGLLQLENGDLQLFAEFQDDNLEYRRVRKKWNQCCSATHGYCGLVIAKGITGVARGNPQLKDMMALMETRFIPVAELGLGTLEMHIEFDY